MQQRIKSNPCSLCQSTYHTKAFCPQNRKPIKVKPYTLKRTPLKKSGKVADLWAKTRAEWYANHPATLFICYICGKHLDRAHTQLDHIKSRARYPELRYDPTNLATICAPCNQAKGSLDLKQYLEKLRITI